MSIILEQYQNSNIFVRNSFARFLCSGSVEFVYQGLCSIFRSMMVSFKKSESTGYSLHFQTVDRRKCPLIGQAAIQVINDCVLVVFVKTRGNPLEYARFFKYIVDQLSDFI